MSSNKNHLFSFLAGAVAGALASTLISKEDKAKIAGNLKDMAASLKSKLEAELASLKNDSKTTEKS